MSSSSDAEPASGLVPHIRQAVAFIARRWRIVVAVAVAGSACAWALSSHQRPKYASTASVLIARQSVASELTGLGDAAAQASFQQLLVTQAHIATTPSVLEDAIRRTGGHPDKNAVDQLSHDAVVKPEEDSDILAFTVANHDPRIASRLSIALAHAYIAYRLKLDTQAISAAIKDVESALAEARAQQGPRSRLASSLASQLEQLQGRAVLQSANAQIIAEPTSATRISPKPVRDTVLGFLLSLALGLTLGVSKDLFGTRLRSEEVRHVLGDLPILGHVDVRDPGAAAKQGRPLMLTSHDSSAQEQFRLLRANLEFSLSATDSVTLLVTSAGPAEGKTTSVANLAVGLALAGKNVVAVDLDLRRPRLHKEFGIPDRPGITGAIVDRVHPDKALVEVPFHDALPHVTAPGRLYVLPAGQLPPAPAEFLGLPRLATLLTALQQRFDYVLCDTPPFSGLSDVTTISTIADAAVVCVRPRVANRSSVQNMLDAMARMDIHLLGAIVTDSRDAPQANYYYGYGRT